MVFEVQSARLAVAECILRDADLVTQSLTVQLPGPVENSDALSGDNDGANQDGNEGNQGVSKGGTGADAGEGDSGGYGQGYVLMIEARDTFGNTKALNVKEDGDTSRGFSGTLSLTHVLHLPVYMISLLPADWQLAVLVQGGSGNLAVRDYVTFNSSSFHPSLLVPDVYLQALPDTPLYSYAELQQSVVENHHYGYYTQSTLHTGECTEDGNSNSSIGGNTTATDGGNMSMAANVTATATEGSAYTRVKWTDIGLHASSSSSSSPGIGGDVALEITGNMLQVVPITVTQTIALNITDYYYFTQSSQYYVDSLVTSENANSTSSGNDTTPLHSTNTTEDSTSTETETDTDTDTSAGGDLDSKSIPQNDVSNVNQYAYYPFLLAPTLAASTGEMTLFYEQVELQASPYSVTTAPGRISPLFTTISDDVKSVRVGERSSVVVHLRDQYGNTIDLDRVVDSSPLSSSSTSTGDGLLTDEEDSDQDVSAVDSLLYDLSLFDVTVRVWPQNTAMAARPYSNSIDDDSGSGAGGNDDGKSDEGNSTNVDGNNSGSSSSIKHVVAVNNSEYVASVLEIQSKFTNLSDTVFLELFCSIFDRMYIEYTTDPLTNKTVSIISVRNEQNRTEDSVEKGSENASIYNGSSSSGNITDSDETNSTGLATTNTSIHNNSSAESNSIGVNISDILNITHSSEGASTPFPFPSLTDLLAVFNHQLELAIHPSYTQTTDITKTSTGANASSGIRIDNSSNADANSSQLSSPTSSTSTSVPTTLFRPLAMRDLIALSNAYQLLVWEFNLSSSMSSSPTYLSDEGSLYLNASFLITHDVNASVPTHTVNSGDSVSAASISSLGNASLSTNATNIFNASSLSSLSNESSSLSSSSPSLHLLTSLYVIENSQALCAFHESLLDLMIHAETFPRRRRSDEVGGTDHSNNQANQTTGTNDSAGDGSSDVASNHDSTSDEETDSSATPCDELFRFSPSLSAYHLSLPHTTIKASIKLQTTQPAQSSGNDNNNINGDGDGDKNGDADKEAMLLYISTVNGVGDISISYDGVPLLGSPFRVAVNHGTIIWHKRTHTHKHTYIYIRT